MPIKRIQFPDGSIKRVEVPDGATDDQILQFVQSQYQAPQAKPDFSSAKGGMKSTEAAAPTGEKRGLMLGARSTLEGVAGVADFISSPLRAGVQFITGQPQATYSDLAGRLSDRAGFPRPQDGRERVLGDVGRALSGTAVTMGAGSALPVASRAGRFLTAQPVAQVAGSATGAAAAGATRENGGGIGAQLAAGLAGGLAPGGLAAAGSGLTRLLVRGGEAGRQAVERAVRDFASVGASPSVGQATGGRGAQGLESLLSAAPTSNGVMTRFAERQAEQIGEGLQAKANVLSPNASAERAGKAVERGADLFKNNVGATKKALYWQADQFVPSNTPVNMQNTWQEVVRLTTPNPGAAATTAAMVNPKIAAMRQTLGQDLSTGGGQVTYDAMKAIRTEIGETLGQYSLVSDTPTREYRALYAALSRDMEAAAASQGPAAVAAAKRANSYTRAAAERMETLSRVVDRNGGPERIYGAVMSGTRDGGTTLHAVMQSLPVEGQKALTAAVIKRMGMATPGMQDAAGDVFSAQTFLTNWNKVSPEAKRALFDRYGPSFAKDVEKLGRVAQTIRDGSRVYANPSGTANRGAALTYLASLGGSVATGNMGAAGALLGGGAVANLTARAMTNPKIVKWLANSTDKPMGAAMASLNMLAQTDPDAQELLEQMQQAQAKK